MANRDGLPPAPGGGYLPYGVIGNEPELTGEQVCEDCGLAYDPDLDNCPRCASDEDGGPDWWEQL